jgi:cytochrome P450
MVNVTHVCTADILTLNLRVINRDQELYGADAEWFNPSRFIDSSTGKLKPPIPSTHDESHLSYGFGRRICPGRALANQSLFVDAASLLWSFSFENPNQAERPLTLGADDYEDHFIMCVFVNCRVRLLSFSLIRGPKPFPYKIHPRFSKVEEILRQSLESA